MATIKGTNGDDQGENQVKDLEGNDVIKALAGDDWIWMLTGGKDTVDGGDGADTVMYESYTTKLTINLREGFVTDADGVTDTLIGIENVHGGRGGDDITMGDDGGYAFGRSGNDTFRLGKNGGLAIVGSGDDKVIGGAGFDTVDFSAQENLDGEDYDGGGIIKHGATVNLKTGKATDGWGDTDTLSGVEGVVGTHLADDITGDAGGNDLRGGAGNDEIDGGGVPLLASGEPTYEEGDNLFGEDGNDTILLTGTGYASGGEGNDDITVAGDGAADGGAGNDTITAKTRGHDGDFDYVALAFNEAQDGIVANLTAKKLGGVAGGSNSKGYNVRDGQGGTDKVFGIHAVNDTRFGDTVYVDGTIKNSYGNSVTVSLSAGNDFVKFIGVDDGAIDYGQAQGAVSIDWAEHEATDLDEADNFIGYDRVVGTVAFTKGSRFGDVIAGDANGERIRGRLGSDTIQGREGNDQLWGDERQDRDGDGNDTLYGGAGNDWLRGGGGKDRFVFDTALSAKTNLDVIDDFDVKDDLIALDRDVFAVGRAGALKATLFADAKTEITKDTRIVYDTKSGDLSYDADGSGKAAAVKFATLENSAKLAAADFVVI